MKKLFKKVTAFTLAEILIALTIIGVVSALTIPNLMKNTQAAQSKTAFKKAMSELNQAIAEYINSEGQNLAQAELSVTDGVVDSNLFKIFETYLHAKRTAQWNVNVHLEVPLYNSKSNTGNIEISQNFKFYNGLLSSTDKTTTYRFYMLPDGTSMIVPENIMGCGRPHTNVYNRTTGENKNRDYGFTNFGNYGCLIYIDINGPKGPNQSLIGVTSNDPTEDACSRIIRPEEDYMVTDNNKEFCRLTDEAITDIYPVVLFNEKAYPATVAGYWVLNDFVGQDFIKSESVIVPGEIPHPENESDDNPNENNPDSPWGDDPNNPGGGGGGNVPDPDAGTAPENPGPAAT